MIKATIYFLMRVKDQHIFYIGQTRKPLTKRLELHIKEAKANKNSNAHKNSLIIDCNYEIDIIMIEEIYGCSEALHYREKFWIQHFCKTGYDLTNMQLAWINKYSFKYTNNLFPIKTTKYNNIPFIIFIDRSSLFIWNK